MLIIRLLHVNFNPQGWASRCPVIDCLFVYLFGLYSRCVSVFRMGVEGIFSFLILLVCYAAYAHSDHVTVDQLSE